MSNPPQQTCIFVLGMHRSGTSALGGALHAAGVLMGKKLVDAAQDNPKGFFEPKRIISFNDGKLLPALKRNWKSIETLPQGWETRPELAALKQEAIALIRDEYGDAQLFGIKDPRICLLAPFWFGVMAELGIRSVAVLPYRHPLEVAGSLQSRDEFTTQQGLALWAEHVIAAEYHSRDMPRAFISYAALLENPMPVLEKIAHLCAVSWPENEGQIQEKLQHFLERKLQHHANADHAGLKDMPRALTSLAELYAQAAQQASEPQDVQQKIDVAASEYRILKDYMLDAYKLHWIEPAQLFADHGEGFGGAEKWAQGISNQSEPQTLVFHLGEQAGTLQMLRFDPLPEPCVVEVLSAKGITLEGKIDLLAHMSGNASARQGNILFFETDDPQIYFRPKDAGLLTQCRQLEITLRILMHGDAVRAAAVSAAQMASTVRNLQSAVHLKSQQLEATEREAEQLQAELVKIYTSHTWQYTRPLRWFLRKIRRMIRHAA